MSANKGWSEAYTVTIDYEALIFEKLRLCNTAFQSPVYYSREEHTKFGGSALGESRVTLERYEDEVLSLYGYIRAIPEWIEQDEKFCLDAWKEWVPKFDVWKKLHNDWEMAIVIWKGTRNADPLAEPIEPTIPSRPIPFSKEVLECKTPKGEWRPFNLHTAILALLHRRGFFKQKSQIETIEGTADEEPNETVGSPTIAVSAGEKSKSLSSS